MIYNMKLKNEPYNLIKSGKKTVELRLYDDKRRRLDVGDKIIFTNMSAKEEQIAVKIRALYRYETFEDLFEEIPAEKCGITSDSNVKNLVSGMRRYYSEEDEKRYGVLGIKVEVCDLSQALDEQERMEEAIVDRYFPDGMK